MVNLSDKSKQFIGDENSIKRCLRCICSNIYPQISKIDDILLEAGRNFIGVPMIGKENSVFLYFMTIKIMKTVL